MPLYAPLFALQASFTGPLTSLYAYALSVVSPGFRVSFQLKANDVPLFLAKSKAYARTPPLQPELGGLSQSMSCCSDRSSSWPS